MVQLSFDIEEFDLPLEYGQSIELSRQIAISELGLNRLLDVLEAEQVKATFYSTVIFMEHISEKTKARLLRNGHEIASHGYYHSKHSDEDYLRSRLRLEKLTGKPVQGYRMARMQAINQSEQLKAGYLYDSSLHPTYLPGRYNHFDKPRLPYLESNGLWTLPASVCPLIRFPLFWLSMHNLPMWLYKRMVGYTARRDGYLNIYFHPWEFADLRELEFELPSIIVRNSGKDFVERLRSLIRHLKAKGYTFGTSSEYLAIRSHTQI